MAMKVATNGLLSEGPDGRVYPMLTVFDDVNGQLVAKEGTANLNDNEGKPVNLMMEAAWQTIDPKVLLEAMAKGTVYREDEIPVKPIRGGYTDGVSTKGWIVQLTPEDQQRFGCEESRAHRAIDGELQTITGVIAITRDAYALAQEMTGKVKTKGTWTQLEPKRPISTGDLLQSIAFVRVNGPVIHQVELNNGQTIRRPGGIAGNQRDVALKAQEEEAKKIAAQRNALSPFANLQVEVTEAPRTTNNNRYRMPIRRG